LDLTLPMIMLTDPDENATTIYEPPIYPQLPPDPHHPPGENQHCFQEPFQQSKSDINGQQIHVRKNSGFVDVEQDCDCPKLPLWLSKEGKLVIKVTALQRKLEGAVSFETPKHFACDVKSGHPAKRKRKPGRSDDRLGGSKRRKPNQPTDGYNPEVASMPDTIRKESEFDRLVMSLDCLTL